MRSLATFCALASAVAAQTGSSIVRNRSPEPFFLWVVPDEKGAPVGERKEVDAGE